jgi:hypothetical protein
LISLRRASTRFFFLEVPFFRRRKNALKNSKAVLTGKKEQRIKKPFADEARSLKVESTERKGQQNEP